VRLLVGTRDGISIVDAAGVREVWRGDVRCLARAGRRIYAGTSSAGLLRSDDHGESWRSLGLEGLALRALAADGEHVVVGAQPVSAHISHDGGTTWRRLDSFPRRPYWWQPANPPHRQGYVSALAMRGGTILAGIEAFKGFRSLDGGVSWQPLRRGFSRDCHALVLAHGRAYEGAGLGPSWSADGGSSWRPLRTGLDRRYVMTIAVDPTDPDCWYVAAAPLTKAHSKSSCARVFRWSGTEWSPASEELRELPHALSCPLPDAIVAGLRDGTILGSDNRGRTWHALARVGRIRALV
jgi:hypothetical protein